MIVTDPKSLIDQVDQDRNNSMPSYPLELNNLSAPEFQLEPVIHVHSPLTLQVHEKNRR